MKLNELLSPLKLPKAVGQIDISNISADSRVIAPNGLFAAIKGTTADGHDFIGAAIQKGAAAILCEHPVENTNATVTVDPDHTPDDFSLKGRVPVIPVKNIRVLMALAADLLYPSPRVRKVAVTGTNGKTSTVYYVAEIMNALGTLTASFGTIGIQSPVFQKEGSMTTPDTVTIHKDLHEMQAAGIQVAAMEASSHGLDQDRLAAVDFVAAGFTNITQDHLDYHKTMGAYLQAKMKLFLQRTAPGGTVVLNADIPEFKAMHQAIAATGLRVISYGAMGEDLKILSLHPLESGQQIDIQAFGKKYSARLSIVGDFQVSNILCAVGLCIGLGADIEQVMAVLPALKAPVGRLERVGILKNQAAIYVDYAHTPDALERVLRTLRPHTKNKLAVVFGCGGNRDTGKRSLMGKIADQYADVVYVTDDNPRFEAANTIRAAILSACPKGIEQGDRHQAIVTAISRLTAGDVLVIAGKGHEAGQKIGDIVYPFDDRIEARLSLLADEKTPLWQADELKACLSVDIPKGTVAFGVSIDTRTLKLGDLFVALKGEKMDGHAFVPMAVGQGASVCLVDHLVPGVPPHKQIVVPDVGIAFNQMALFARHRSEAAFIGITGSSGKTTTKEMLKLCLADQGHTYATKGNYNNQIGVPLTLTNMPLNTQYAIIEMGMNHPGELTQLSALVQPHTTLITMIGTAHLASFKDESEIASAKAEIFSSADSKGTAILNADSPFYSYLRERAIGAGIKHITSFGQAPGADFKLLKIKALDDRTEIFADWHGTSLNYSIGFLGLHFALNSLAVLGAVDAVGASVEQAADSLAQSSAVAGRGASETLTLPGGRFITLIDDAYNANPSSVQASLNTLGLRKESIKIAVLGDMLELGPNAIALHVGLKQSLIDNHITKVYAVGFLMKHLYEALDKSMQGAWTQTPEEMVDVLIKELPSLAAVLVKSSNGTNLKKIITELKEHQ